MTLSRDSMHTTRKTHSHVASLKGLYFALSLLLTHELNRLIARVWSRVSKDLEACRCWLSDILTNSHALVPPERRSTVVYSARVPQDKVSRFHARLHPLAAAVEEPLEFLIGPVEQVTFEPSILWLCLLG